ncbi:MAG: acetate--CoA ligase family protein [bacterium]
MKTLFYPDSIAIVGASNSPTNLAQIIVMNLINWGYGGRIYGVNPNGEEVFGKKIYPALTEIPDEIDLTVILAPARTIPDTLTQCRDKGIKYVIIETAGFSEFSSEGDKLGDEIKTKARKYGIRFVGPNCVGIVNAEHRMCLPFAPLERWEPGNVSIVSQSGGVGLSLLMWLAEHNLSCNKFISIGNKYDLDETDFLRYLMDDAGTEVIIMFLESLVHGREFAEVARKGKKPVLVYKAGGTGAGRERAASHTAALANDEAVLDAALRQAGVVRVSSINQLASFARMFTQPKMKGRRIAAISAAGGYTVVTADHAERRGFVFPKLSSELINQIQSRVRAGVIRISNPLDLGDAFAADNLLFAIEKCLQEPQIHGVVFINPRRPDQLYAGPLSVMYRNIIPDIEKLVLEYGKPVSTGVLGLPATVVETRGSSTLPIYPTPEEAVDALASYRDFCTRKKRSLRIPSRGRKKLKTIKNLLTMCHPQSRLGVQSAGGFLTGKKALDIVHKTGLRIPKMKEVKTLREALDAASALRFPIAAKISSPSIIHKTEVGGIRLNIKNLKELRAAYRELDEIRHTKCPDDKTSSIFLQDMTSGGVEVLVGGRQDPHFGPVIVFGSGGVAVEVFKVIAIRLAPVSRQEAREMIAETRGSMLLEGFRGSPPRDISALTDVICKVSELICAFPEINELDINPLIVLPQGRGCIAVDVRIGIGEDKI